MIAAKKISKEKFLSGCRCLTKDSKVSFITLNKSQILVGHSKHADYQIDHPSVSFYHALFLVIDDHVEIVDLTPNQQLTVNGNRVGRANLFEGDKISIGKLVFAFEYSGKSESFEELNPNVSKFSPPPPPLKIVPSHHSTPQYYFANPDLPVTLVDGDPCQLTLTEDQSWINQDKPKWDVADLDKNYIETVENSHATFYPDSVKKTEEHLIISYLCTGQLVAMDTLLSNKMLSSKKSILAKHLSPEIAQWWDNKDVVFSKENEAVIFHPPSNFSESNIEVKEEQTFVTLGMHQIAFSKKVMRKDQKFKTLWHDRDEFLQGLSYFSAFIVPILFLLLVDVPKIKEPEKEQVVIYTTEVIEGENEPTPNAGGAVEMITKVFDKPAVAPVIDHIKGDQPKSEDKSQDTAVAEPKAAEQVASKFSSLFSKTNVKTSETSFDNQKTGGTGTSEDYRKALKGSGSGKVGTVGGGQIKGLFVDAGLSGKKGFKSGKGVGKGEFDAGFTASKTVILGSIDPELLRKLLREYIPQFRYCYQNELIKNPNLTGTIDLNFTLNGKGKVVQSDVRAKGGKFSERGINCMEGVLKMIAFPAPKGGGKVDVRQPLNFSAERTKI